MVIPSKTPEELKQLALDVYKGHVFVDAMVPQGVDPRMVFLVFSLMTPEQIDDLRKDEPGMIYEYLSQAGPHSVNGLPSFFSFKMLNQEDAKTMRDMVHRLLENEKIILKGDV